MENENENEIDVSGLAVRGEITSENLRDWIDAAAALDWLAAYEADYDLESEIGDVAEAAYWFALEHHGGHGSPEYALLCAVGKLYTPGSCMRGCPDKGESAEIYNMLVEAWEKAKA